MNRFLSPNASQSKSLNRFTTRNNKLASAQTKGSRCRQYNEVEIAADDFILDVLEFFFNERLDASQLNDSLRELAAKLVDDSIEKSRLMDLIPRPAGFKPGVIWLVSQAVQLAWRKAQNGCRIYESIRVVIKNNWRSIYEMCKNGIDDSAQARSMTNSLAFSANGQNLLKRFEGFRTALYDDAAGHCTIGYGTLVHHGNCNGSEVDEFRNGISEDRATELLVRKVTEIESVINSSVSVALNQNQFDALVSLAYNIGISAFKKSTLLRILNQGNYSGVPSEINRWVHSGGRVLDGLVQRRSAEAELFSSRTMAAAQSISGRFSRPMYDTGEHAVIGTYLQQVSNSPLSNVPAFDPLKTYDINSVPFTYGQIITLGDFYESYDDAARAPVQELTRLKTLIIRAENHYKNTIFHIGSATSNPGDSDWSDPNNGIGRRYLDLAIRNYSHFAPPSAVGTTTTTNNKQEWQRYHERAINHARQGLRSGDLDVALSINAFGDHFLTDAFSAGHLVNKEEVMNIFIRNVMSGGSVNSAGKKLFERIADATLAVPELNRKLSRFETTNWPYWDLNDTGLLYPEVFYRILVKIMEDTANGGAQKIANLAVKGIHDHLNRNGIRVRNRFESWTLKGDGTLNPENVLKAQNAVKQSAENISDAVSNPSTSISTYFQKVWDFVPAPANASDLTNVISIYTTPTSDRLVRAAVQLLEDQLDLLLNELLAGSFIQCRSNTSARTVADCR